MNDDAKFGADDGIHQIPERRDDNADGEWDPLPEVPEGIVDESYLLANRAADAKREALAALEIAPSFERAQELLLKAIDGGQPPPAKVRPGLR